LTFDECKQQKSFGDQDAGELFPFDGYCRNKCEQGFKGFTFENQSTCVPDNLKTCNSIRIANFTETSLELYQGCQIVLGSIDIDKSDNLCDKFSNFEFLLGIFKDIREIYGYLSIKNSSRIKDLSFMTELRKIRGLSLKEGNALILIGNKDMTNSFVTSQNVSIERGNVRIKLTSKSAQFKNMTNIDVNVTVTTYALQAFWTLPIGFDQQKPLNYAYKLCEETRFAECTSCSYHMNFLKTITKKSFAYYMLPPNTKFLFQIKLLDPENPDIYYAEEVAESTPQMFVSSKAFIDVYTTHSDQEQFVSTICANKYLWLIKSSTLADNILEATVNY